MRPQQRAQGRSAGLESAPQVGASSRDSNIRRRNQSGSGSNSVTPNSTCRPTTVAALCRDNTPGKHPATSQRRPTRGRSAKHTRHLQRHQIQRHQSQRWRRTPLPSESPRTHLENQPGKRLELIKQRGLRSARKFSPRAQKLTCRKSLLPPRFRRNVRFPSYRGTETCQFRNAR